MQNFLKHIYPSAAFINLANFVFVLYLSAIFLTAMSVNQHWINRDFPKERFQLCLRKFR